MSSISTDGGPHPAADLWSDWLLHRRHADDPDYERVLREEVEQYADRVLDAARLAPGMTLADIGTGEGLLAFRAIDRIGPSLRVLLTDISQPLLKHAEQHALERGIAGQCAFIHCPADDLNGIGAASVDVVMTRAVLAYVADKPAALAEFYRVLKPGGRISIAEPIFQDDAFVTTALKRMVDAQSPGSTNRVLPLLHRWKAAQFPDTEEKIAQSPLANYSERNLMEFVHRAGFGEIHLELHIDMFPCIVTSWDVVLGSSPHPWAPTLRAILAKHFTPDERQLFEQVLRPVVESGQAVTITRSAYVSARKPSSATSTTTQL